jgi:TatD DNase family protein
VLKIIDTHAHLNFRAFKDDGDEIIKKTLEGGAYIINVGAAFETSKKAVEIAEKYSEGVFAAIGLHPIHIGDEEFSYEKYKELAENKKVVAIGETGLDYHRIMNNESGIIEKQKEIFKKQIELAIELNKPLIIHCREAFKENKIIKDSAHDNILKILNSHFKIHNSKLHGVIHSFSGNVSQAREYRKLGFKIAFNGIITFARDYDGVVLDTPLEDILIETDCPYLTPIPYRGQRNEPLYVIEVAKKLAEIKKIDLGEVVKQTTENAKEVFDI